MINTKNKSLIIAATLCCLLCLKSFWTVAQYPATGGEKQPKIVNIVNFIRLLEPRDEKITEDVLYQTVVSQVKLMKENKLGGTFLLQYDALMDARYQKLLKGLPTGTFEVGAWWEIPQPLVENAGLKWRGRYPWDWDADVDFSPGYSHADREKLVDVYMKDFKQIFGYYPKSVGSWYIDAYTLNYMYKKYGIVASCNCKDQVGTDGYTLWGGYWNQAYYPSVNNGYMPAQHEQNQIPVPIFRMLGSDPVRQYDNGLGSTRQGVVTLEPVYQYGGGDNDWVNWYFKQFVEGASMEYAYVQAGQENSFTWDPMSKGLGIQFPLIAKLRDEHKIKVETLQASGEWFRKKFKTTPATSVTVNQDVEGSDKKTVWFNSRFYRLNLLWDKGTLRFRDIHLFNENLSEELSMKNKKPGLYELYTLPFVDGYIWSKASTIAGLRLKAIIGGKEMDITGGNPVISDAVPGKLHITWPLTSLKGTFMMDITEQDISMKMEGNDAEDWYLSLTAADGVELPFKNITDQQVDCSFRGIDYQVNALKGSFSKTGDGIIFKIQPQKQVIALHFKG